jgi:hypothetical protein
MAPVNTSSGHIAKRSKCRPRQYNKRFRSCTERAPLAETGLDASSVAGTGAPDDLLNSSEVAALVGLSEGTIDLWAQDGQLKGLRSAGAWRFFRHDVDSFLVLRGRCRGSLRDRLDDSRLGNPWFLRPTRGSRVEPAADFDGGPLPACCFRRGGMIHYASDSCDPPGKPLIRRARSRLAELRRRTADEMEKCRRGGYSEEELTVFDGIVKGRSLGRWPQCSIVRTKQSTTGSSGLRAELPSSGNFGGCGRVCAGVGETGSH